MSYENTEALPQDTQSLPQAAKQIFMAAFNAASSDGFSEDGARDVAWSSVKNTFAQDGNGEWYFRAEDRDSKSTTGTMPGG
ncbi:ChaB family protein [Leptolyngbya sp. CCNP1308]|uniref:ChaB family protein n=1 Tax=Leptolyngbya sp. CCNP1308 TaxID=3110255 RepID=UPI002B21DACF|nr:ChaB family protein [Leptolyngbya sp. CCNP1308]MEA5451177.1 ChaB family protein [Leptolyngbya sp. CCNP1308]